MLNLRYIILLCCTLVLMGCENDFLGVKTDYAIYQDDNKLWAHRANDVSTAQEMAAEFQGVEVDVFYNKKDDCFYVKHDEEEADELKLWDYFSGLENEGLYYWIDLKNLSLSNRNDVNDRLHDLFMAFNLFHKAIVESTNTAALQYLWKRDIYCSYWVPHLTPTADADDSLRLIMEISEKLQQCNYNALSAHHSMYPFLKKYFGNCNLHFWTNGLKTEEHKDIIKEMAANNAVKVILVDYKENFLLD